MCDKGATSTRDYSAGGLRDIVVEFEVNICCYCTSTMVGGGGNLEERRKEKKKKKNHRQKLCPTVTNGGQRD